MTQYAMTDITVEVSIEEKVLLPEDVWPELSMDALIEQKDILFNRWMYLAEHRISYAADVKKGLDKIEKFISER